MVLYIVKEQLPKRSYNPYLARGLQTRGRVCLREVVVGVFCSPLCVQRSQCKVFERLAISGTQLESAALLVFFMLDVDIVSCSGRLYTPAGKEDGVAEVELRAWVSIDVAFRGLSEETSATNGIYSRQSSSLIDASIIRG